VADGEAREEYVLAVGVYGSAEDALTDLRDLTNPGPTAEVIAGAAVLTRGPGRSALQQGGGGSTAFGVGTGAAVGIAAGALLPLPLAGAAAVAGIGASVGAVVGRRIRTREADHLVGLVADDLPVGGTALVVVVAARFQREVRRSMHGARTTTARLIDDPTARRLARGLVRGDPDATEALGG